MSPRLEKNLGMLEVPGPGNYEVKIAPKDNFQYSFGLKTMPDFKFKEQK